MFCFSFPFFRVYCTAFAVKLRSAKAFQTGSPNLFYAAVKDVPPFSASVEDDLDCFR